MKNWQIAIDGPAAAGKSTIAKILAQNLGFEYLDTGAMYRAATIKALRLKVNLLSEAEYEFIKTTDIEYRGGKIYLDDEDVTDEIRSIDVTNNVSVVCKYKTVRERMVHLQREMAKAKNIVMEGRDIGTVVLPFADLKIFLTATPEVRGKRRLQERFGRGMSDQSLADMISEIKARDEKDSHRELDPLKKADDAIEIDTSKLNIIEVVKIITRLVEERGWKMDDVIQINDSLKEEEKQEKEAPVADASVKKDAPEVKEDAPVADVSVKKEDAPEEDALEKEEEPEKDALGKDDAPKADAPEVKEEPLKQEEKQKKFRELQLVEGVVRDQIASKPEYVNKKGEKIKAKDARVLMELANGDEGYLLFKDTEGYETEEDFFFDFKFDSKHQAIIKKIYSEGHINILLSTKLLKKRENLSKYQELIDNHGTFTAKVIRNIENVGLILEHEGYSCLLPTSQINGNHDLENVVGTTIDVSPIRVDYNRIRLIVSERVATAIKEKNAREEFLKTVAIGNVYEGIVKNIENYGAFVELDKSGVEGLLHISEIEHNRIVRVDKVLNPGDQVKVQVIRLEGEHIGLSRKALIPNYWKDFVDSVKIGDIVKGKVIEINNSGVVVEFNEHVQGFLPKSESSWERDTDCKDLFVAEEEVELKLIEVDLGKKRIILSKKQMIPNPWETLQLKRGKAVNCKVMKVIDQGIRLDVEGASGFLPSSYFGDKSKTDFALGSEFTAYVSVFDPARHRLIVNLKKDERGYTRHQSATSSEISKYLKNQDQVSNTFGDFINLDDFKER